MKHWTNKIREHFQSFLDARKVRFTSKHVAIIHMVHGMEVVAGEDKKRGWENSREI